MLDTFILSTLLYQGEAFCPVKFWLWEIGFLEPLLETSSPLPTGFVLCFCLCFPIQRSLAKNGDYLCEHKLIVKLLCCSLSVNNLLFLKHLHSYRKSLKMLMTMKNSSFGWVNSLRCYINHLIDFISVTLLEFQIVKGK